MLCKGRGGTSSRTLFSLKCNAANGISQIVTMREQTRLLRLSAVKVDQPLAHSQPLVCRLHLLAMVCHHNASFVELEHTRTHTHIRDTMHSDQSIIETS
eukprot:4812801-Amphidinium_carterae.3